ncbi:MAG: CinA family nicotinamide mononucleotide deamidase-related protein [Thalassotalea sp.]
MTQLNIQLLLTGNEIMSGDVTDTNSVMIAQALKAIGAEVTKKTAVADNISLLVSEILSISQHADVLIINGGLGPTVDDLTAQALAQANNTSLMLNKEAEHHLQQWCNQKGVALSKANLKQALLPENAQIIANTIGSAVGFTVTINHCDIYCTPGVPRELSLMLVQSIIPAVQTKLPATPSYIVKRFQTYGIGESNLQTLIEQHFPIWPKDIELGFRANRPFVEVKLTSKNNNGAELLPLWSKKIQQLLGAHILDEISQNERSMPAHILSLLFNKNLQITTAESCTGGLIASQITSIANASASFEAGFVTYSNPMKTALLGVKKSTLARHGAVSQAVVEEMALGALKQSGADIAIAVSGIAGPSGGSKEKPVGSVWIAWGSATKINSQYFCIKGSRQDFQHAVTYRALDLTRRFLLDITDQPWYIR